MILFRNESREKEKECNRKYWFEATNRMILVEYKSYEEKPGSLAGKSKMSYSGADKEQVVGENN